MHECVNYVQAKDGFQFLCMRRWSVFQNTVTYIQINTYSKINKCAHSINATDAMKFNDIRNVKSLGIYIPVAGESLLTLVEGELVD